jgi:PH (Pleckstrin Homology) domain-containing protein
MMELRQETTLAKVRLHWGIFIPVLLLALVLIVASLSWMLFAHAMDTVLSQMPRQIIRPAAVPRLNLFWLLPLVLDFVIVPFLLLGTWFSYSRSEVTLTDRRLVFRTGFLSRRSGELPLENVESIYISESLLGRLCGYGTVMVTTVGGARLPLAFIGSPQSFHSTLQKAVLDARNSVRRSPKPLESGSPPQDDDRRYRPKG